MEGIITRILFSMGMMICPWNWDFIFNTNSVTFTNIIKSDLAKVVYCKRQANKRKPIRATRNI